MKVQFGDTEISDRVLFFSQPMLQVVTVDSLQCLLYGLRDGYVDFVKHAESVEVTLPPLPARHTRSLSELGRTSLNPSNPARGKALIINSFKLGIDISTFPYFSTVVLGRTSNLFVFRFWFTDPLYTDKLSQ